MVNLHAVNRVMSVQILETDGSGDLFITPLLDVKAATKGEISTVNPHGIDTIVEAKGHSYMDTISFTVILNEKILKVISLLIGNPNLTDAITTDDTFVSSSSAKKIENFLRGHSFDFAKKLNISVITTRVPINFTTPSNVVTALTRGIGEVTTYFDCAFSMIGDTSTAGDYIKITLDATASSSETQSKLSG